MPPETAVFGEVGLTGEVRGVLQAQARAREAQTLGFKKLILPESNKKGLEKLLGIRVVGVKNLEQAMDESVLVSIAGHDLFEHGVTFGTDIGDLGHGSSEANVGGSNERVDLKRDAFDVKSVCNDL